MHGHLKRLATKYVNQFIVKIWRDYTFVMDYFFFFCIIKMQLLPVCKGNSYTFLTHKQHTRPLINVGLHDL